MKGEADKPLTPKQQRFIEEYLVDCNATQAAIRAGYSEKTASEQGSRMLGNVKVRESIEKAKSNLSERTQTTQEQVIEELKKIALDNLFSLGTNAFGDPFVKVSDKLKALDMLADHIGMKDKDRNKSEGPVTYNIGFDDEG